MKKMASRLKLPEEDVKRQLCIICNTQYNPAKDYEKVPRRNLGFVRYADRHYIVG